MMFDEKRSQYAREKLGLGSEYSIIYAAVSASYMSEDDVIASLGIDEDSVGQVSNDELLVAMQECESDIKLPDGHFVIGMGKEDSEDKLKFYVLDFSVFNT